ncbi:hypothetical protein SDC9_116381 [bioreactor metagenome]|uniref:Uncharacterized protein n=1 Tax=bioreactor metagenome TaxID=1076179 RepID=A0A645BVC8_9ZZZZ
MPYCFDAKPSLYEIFHARLSTGRHQNFVEITRRFLVDFIISLFISPLPGILSLVRNLHSGALSQLLYRGHIVKSFYPHYKGDYISARSAAETVKMISGRINGK